MSKSRCDCRAGVGHPNHDEWPPGTGASADLCPECGRAGKSVNVLTVKSNLSVSLRQMVVDEYQFCGSEGCSVVYFSTGALTVFRSGELRERVYQKDPERDDVLVCYCFQHRVGDMRRSSPEDRDSIANSITEGTRTGQCACEIRNPQGSCCLGNVRELIQHLNHYPTADEPRVVHRSLA